MANSEFSTDLEKALEKGSTGEIVRWVRSFRQLQTEMAGKLLFLARHLDSIPTEVRAKYIDELITALEAVPDEARIRTSIELKEKLEALADSIEQVTEKARLRTAIEMHTTVS